MYKIIIFIVIILCGVLISYNERIINFFINNNSFVHIKDDNSNYKNSPLDKKGKIFVGDSLEIYKVTREKLLPIENDIINHTDNKNIDNSKEQIDKLIQSEKNLIEGNIYLQLAAYKSRGKAELFIKNYDIPASLKNNNLILNIVSVTIPDKGLYYRIRIGPYKNYNDVYKLCFELNLSDNACLIINDK